jgi:hypothetical protein
VRSVESPCEDADTGAPYLARPGSCRPAGQEGGEAQAGCQPAAEGDRGHIHQILCDSIPPHGWPCGCQCCARRRQLEREDNSRKRIPPPQYGSRLLCPESQVPDLDAQVMRKTLLCVCCARAGA